MFLYELLLKEVIIINNIEILKFSSLLHDIGKFYQRTKYNHNESYNNLNQEDFGRNGAHGKWSADFVKEFFGEDIEDLVLYHHNPKSSNNQKLCDIVTKADHHSSKERLKSQDKQTVSKSPLVSIFSEINLDYGKNEEYYVPLKELSLGLDSFEKSVPTIEKPMKGWNLQPEYNILWSNFINELKKLRNKDFNSLLNLLRKYTSTMPSAVYTSKGDISLYDHSKTTAAIAICRYLFENETKDLKKTDEQEVYLTINGDLSGIQKFIYKVSSPQDAQRGMSKRLRGRSLYLSLLSDAIANSIINELNLSQANILFCGGGRFTIIGPNTEKTINKLVDIENKVNKFFIDHFNAELFLALDFIKCSGVDLEDFGKLTQKLSDKMEQKKKHKFINNLSDVFKIEDNVNYSDTCMVCGNKVDDSKELKICKDCDTHGELGRKAGNADYIIKVFTDEYNKIFDLYFKELKIAYIFKKSSDDLPNFVNKLSDSFEKIELVKLNDTKFLEYAKDINRDNVSFSFQFLGNTVPRYSSKNPLYFEHLAEISKGSNKLGILKMDVDNLGLIFSEGFDEDSKASISRVSTLSSSLDMFFSGFINDIAEEFVVFKDNNGSEDSFTPIKLTFQDENSKPLTVYKAKNGVDISKLKGAIPTILINYSGGDDLLVLGSYDDIIKFAKEFRDKFKKWTCNNPSINISGGIAIVEPKFPIGKGAEIAEKFLSASKSCGKDKITLFGEILPWDSDKYKGFNELFEFSEELETYVENEKVSMGFVYSLLNIWRKSFNLPKILLDDKDKWDNDNFNRCRTKKFVPKLKYKLRLVKDKNLKDNLNKNILKIMPWMDIPVSWVSLRMR